MPYGASWRTNKTFTSKDVARIAGVSQSTVSRVLSGVETRVPIAAYLLGSAAGLAPAMFVLAWYAVATFGKIPPVFLPGPDRAWNALVSGFATGNLTTLTMATVELWKTDQRASGRWAAWLACWAVRMAATAAA